MDKYAQKDKKNMCNNCKETNQPENPTAINAAVELKEASDAVKRIHSAISDKGLTYYIETYGCQMNEHDSENIAGMLVRCGYTKADCKETAYFISISDRSGCFDKCGRSAWRSGWDWFIKNHCKTGRSAGCH